MGNDAKEGDFMDRFWENVIRWMAALSGIVVGWWGGWTAGSKVLVNIDGDGLHHRLRLRP